MVVEKIGKVTNKTVGKKYFGECASKYMYLLCMKLQPTHTAVPAAAIRAECYYMCARLFKPCALLRKHFTPIASVLLSKSFNASVQQFIT